MRKYILALLVFIAGLTSCTNDDITISYATNFKINPLTVISPFTFEVTAGQLESFGSDYKLRIRLLIYNSEGTLVKEDTQYFTNYATVMSSSQDLPNGEYISLVVTDVVKYVDNTVTFEYWNLSDHNKLGETKIEDAGYIGLQNKILGISKTNFTVSNASNDDITINVQPAGALIFVYYANIRTYSNVVTYGLKEAKTGESCIFDNQGNYSVSVENNNGSFDWWLDRMDLADFEKNIQNVYSFVFVLPMSNLNLKFEAITDNNEKVNLSDVITINPKAGEEYLFQIDLAKADNNYNVGYGIVNGTRSVNKILNIDFTNTAFLNRKAAFLKDIK